MLKIYGVPFSVHTRKVIVTAIEKGLPYENVPVVPVIPDSPPANWAQLSPTGKIPVLTDGGLTVADSTVICAYLDRKHPAPPMYPADDAAYIQALWFEEYADGTVFREVVQPLVYQTFVRAKVRQQPVEQAAVEAVCAQAVPKVFGYLDSVVGDGFIAGSQLSVADVALVSNLVTYQYVGFSLSRERYPRLHAYFQRILRQPSVTRALREEQGVVDSVGLQRKFLDDVMN